MTVSGSIELAEALFELDQQEDALLIELASIRATAIEQQRNADLLTMVEALRRRSRAALDLLLRLEEESLTIEHLELDGTQLSARGSASAADFEPGLFDLQVRGCSGVRGQFERANAQRLTWSLVGSRDPAPTMGDQPLPHVAPEVPPQAPPILESPARLIARRRRDIADLRAQIALASMFGLGPDPRPRPSVPTLDAVDVEARLAALTATDEAAPLVERDGRRPNAWRQLADAWRVRGRAPLASLLEWMVALHEGAPLLGFEQLVLQRDGEECALEGLLLSYRV